MGVGRKKNFNNLIYGLDIETSTINIDDENKGSFMYSFCVGSLNFSNGIYKDEKLGRTYNDLDNYLYELNDIANDLDTDYIVYIHNFSYEYSFFCNNLKFFREYSTYKKGTYLFMEQNKPLYLKLDRLEFRCSYLLLNKSISSIGDSIGLPKLDYNYDKLRTPLTSLDNDEIKYNFRDVEIMLKGVYQLFKNNQYMSTTNDLPFTKTGVMRFNCENNPQVNVKKEYINKNGKKRTGSSEKLNKYLCKLEKAETQEQLDFWEKLFQGGLVYSNPKYVSDVVENISSYDFSSDYPFQMLVRYYPSQFKEYNGDRVRKLNQCMYKSGVKNYAHSKPFRNMFNAIVHIKNIKCKFDFQPIGTSKIEVLDTPLKNMNNCIIINGKILEIKPTVSMYVTCIDYLTLQLFYDFELVDVVYLEIATRYKKSNEYKLNSVEFNAKAKVEYKVYDTLINETGKYKIYTKEEINNDMYRDLINNEKDYFNQLETSSMLYHSVKGDLNALYGDNAQHLLHDRIKYNYQSRDWEKEKETFEDYRKAQHKTSYIYGLYVPQYARASILYIAYMFLTNGIDVLYIDTDSIKVISCKKADKLVEDYNNIQLRLLGTYDYLGFGILEREYVADKFSSLGTKSYIKLESDKSGNKFIKATISGLPHATKIFNELYEYFDYNFDEMIENVYHYGTVFKSDITKKLSSTYKFIDFDVDIDGYKDTLVSGVVLNPCDVTMRDFTSKTWYIYARLICRIYKKDYNKFTSKTIITRNNKGGIEVYNG